MDLSGVTLQIVIRTPYQDCSGFVLWLYGKSDAIVACQHDADDDIKSTHVHIAVLRPCGVEGIRKQLVNRSLGGKNSSIMLKTLKGRVPYDFYELAKYCVKGDSTTIRYTSLGDQMMKELQSKWVAPRTEVALAGGVFVKQSKIHAHDSKYAIVQECVSKIAGWASIGNEQLVAVVREALVKREMALGMYKVMDICDAVLMYSGRHSNKWSAAAVAFLDKRYG